MKRITLLWLMVAMLLGTGAHASNYNDFFGSGRNDLFGSTPGAILSVAASDSTAGAQVVADYRCNGTADNVEIQSAIDKTVASGVGGVVILLPGNYLISDGITIYRDIKFRGTGNGNSNNGGVVIKLADNTTLTNGGMIFYNGPHSASFIEISNFTLNGNRDNQTGAQGGHGIFMYGTSAGIMDIQIDRVFSMYHSGCAAVLGVAEVDPDGTASNDVAGHRVWGLRVTDSLFELSDGHGMYLSSEECYLQNCYFAGNGQDGLRMGGCFETSVIQCSFGSNGMTGLSMNKIGNVNYANVVEGCIAWNNNTTDASKGNYFIGGATLTVFNGNISRGVSAGVDPYYGLYFSGTTSIITDNIFTDTEYGFRHGLTGLQPTITFKDNIITGCVHSYFDGAMGGVNDAITCEDVFTNPPTSSMDKLVEPVEPVNGALTVRNQPDCSRNICVRLTDSDSSITAGLVLTLIGTDSRGQTRTEVLTFAGTGTEQIDCTYGYSQLTSATLSAVAGTVTGDTIKVGTGTKLALRNPLAFTADVFSYSYDGADKTVPTVTVEGLVSVDTPNGSHDYILRYRSNQNVFN